MKQDSDKLDIAKQSKGDLLRLILVYRQAIDKSIISSITDVKGTIVYANENFCEITKYSLDELIGQKHSIINSGHHSKYFFKMMWKTIGSGSVWQNEVKNKAKDGTYYWVDTVVVPIKDSKGKIVQYLSLRTLITQRKQLEDEKIEYIKSLEEMLFMTSHKVRQPVANILGLADQFDHFINSPDEIIKMIGFTKESALSLDAFTKELTTFIYEVKEMNKKKNSQIIAADQKEGEEVK